MSTPEYQPLPQPVKPEERGDTSESGLLSSINAPEVSVTLQDESPFEILERYIEQDRDTGKNLRRDPHLKAVEEHPDSQSAPLITKKRLEEILNDARRKGIPHSLLESLWDLRNCHPEHVEEPPIVRAHALSDVIRPMWEQGLDHELKNDLLFDLEGEEAMEKLYVPQPRSEIDDPQNLYQLIGKACERNRMEELLRMIEESDYVLLGKPMEEGAALYREKLAELGRTRKRKMSKERGRKSMPVPEYGNNGAEAPEPGNNSNESLPASPVDLAQDEPDESVREIVDRFVKQDRKLGHGIERLHHSQPDSKPATELLERRLNEIFEHARREDIPYKLLGYLWELWDTDPEMIKEPPLVREHALSDVIRPMWEQRLEYELESYLFCELEGYENEHRVEEPQPQEEIDAPQNLYQLVRKAWDQNRMDELLAMIEENDDALLGVTLKEAVAPHRGTGS